MRPNRAILALTVAGLTWGLTVPLSKVVLGWLDPAWTAAGRFALAAPVLALIGRRRLREAATPAVAAWGAVGFGLVILVQNFGIERTSVTHAAVIVGAVPILVAVAAAAAGRGHSGPRAWLGFAVALAGIGLVAGSGGRASVSGDLLMLGSATISALTIVAQARLLEGRDPVAVTAVQMTAAAVATAPLALLAGTPPAAAPTAGQALAAAGLVTLGSLLPFTLYAYGQARVSPQVAGAFVNLEPLVGAAVGALVFHDPFGGGHAMGALAIVGGTLLSVGHAFAPTDALPVVRNAAYPYTDGHEDGQATASGPPPGVIDRFSVAAQEGAGAGRSSAGGVSDEGPRLRQPHAPAHPGGARRPRAVLAPGRA